MIRRTSQKGVLRRASAARPAAASAASAAAAALLLVGCGGGGLNTAPTKGAGAGATTSTESTSAVGAVLNVTASEYSFTPKTLKASAGQNTIRFVNGGVMEHDFAIDALDIRLTAAPGKTTEATVTLVPGTYKISCTIPGHLQVGMQGTLKVS